MVVALGVLLAAESLAVPLKMSRPNVSSFYSWLETQTDGAVIDLHSGPNAAFYQTIHHKKMLSAPIVSRASTDALSFRAQEPLRQLLAENRPLYFVNRRPGGFPSGR